MNTRTALQQTPPFKRSPLFWSISSSIVLMLGGAGSLAHAQEYFNPAFLELGDPAQAGADLSIFEDSRVQAPGKYYVDIYLNNSQVETREIDFALAETEEGKKLVPCLTAGMLESLGVRIDAFPELNDGTSCTNLAAIPEADTQFQFSKQRLDISIPQAALFNTARGYISPELWDDGIPVVMVNYNFSGANTDARSAHYQNSDVYYLNLRSGVNVGAWRVRNYSTWSRNSDGSEDWDNIQTYAQRDIKALKSQLTVGDSSSPAEIFDSVAFRGVQLASDDDMLPDSMKGYSPVVRGVARTNAQITIRQNGYTIYQGFVPPGAFEINDLFPTSGSGDLYVTVEESDGEDQTFIVPFASVPVLQREGRFKYSVTVGEYRPYNDDIDNSNFIQGTFMYGLPWRSTLYGGTQLAGSKYRSASLGWGQNMGRIGALSLDVTQSWAEPHTTPEEKESKQGQSWRLRYGKSFVETGTNFSLASYRYSTRGFYTMAEALDTYGPQTIDHDQKKTRAEMTVSQNLGDRAGSLSLSFVEEKFWNNDRKRNSFSLGYSNNWKRVSYSVYYSYNKNGSDRYGNRIEDTQQTLSFNISVPLGNIPNSYARYSANSQKHGNTTHTVGLYGSALEDNNLSYSVSQGYTNKGVGAQGNASVNYRGGMANAGVGVSYDRDMQRLNYNLDGTILLHEDGVTLSQPVVDQSAMALIKAPGAKGVRIRNRTGVKTDWRGYAVVPYLSPYRKSEIALDPHSYGEDLELNSNVQNVIPSRGAVVRASFETNVGHRALITLLRDNGQPVPFAALVTIGEPSQQGSNSFTAANNNIVGDGGQVYLSGLQDQGVLHVQWGQDASQQCQASFSLADAPYQSGIRMATGECR